MLFVHCMANTNAIICNIIWFQRVWMKTARRPKMRKWSTNRLVSVMYMNGLIRMSKARTKLNGINLVPQNGPDQEYQLDVLFIKHLPDQNDRKTMLCTDAFTKCSLIVINNTKQRQLVWLQILHNVWTRWGRNHKLFIPMERHAL